MDLFNFLRVKKATFPGRVVLLLIWTLPLTRSLPERSQRCGAGKVSPAQPCPQATGGLPETREEPLSLGLWKVREHPCSRSRDGVGHPSVPSLPPDSVPSEAAGPGSCATTGASFKVL